ncbi:MAG TPA: SHOCT domain-containing protein [Syntrophomonadaceae bacterium]|nr:SHOCT domain-containing protein [Syntrophomonadaceae bacterium]HPR93797.1 SHOCT domain-containing protein [Syntrophomonadaceae bacterium]
MNPQQKEKTMRMDRDGSTVQKEAKGIMTQAQFEREKAYRAEISIAKSMLKNGLITEPEFQKIDRIMLEKYCPVQGCLGC